MKISTRARYGLRFMMALARKYGQNAVFLKEIADQEHISSKYLSQIVIPLKSRGLINAYRGAHGGYALGKPPEHITIKDIVEPLEGDLSLVDCAGNASAYSREPFCSGRDIWAMLGKQISKFLESYSLRDAVDMQKKKGGGFDYHI